MTPKQEAFARAYVETGNASEAYRRAYNAENMSPDAIKVNACKLLKSANVALTVAKLKAVHQKRHEITIDRLTRMALKAYKEAQRVSPTSGQMQTASMVKSAEFLGKLHGLLVEKSEVKHVAGAEDMTDDELASLARSGCSRAAAPPAGTPKPN